MYPIGEADPAPPIYAFVRRLEREGLKVRKQGCRLGDAEPVLAPLAVPDVEPGPLSTLVAGDSALIFMALREAYEEAGLLGRRALVVKVIN